MAVRATLVLAAGLLAIGAGAGCGGSRHARRPPAPTQPSRSPAPSTTPAGRVVRIGAAAEGVAVDPRSGIVAVGVRHPDGIDLVDGRTGALVRRLGVPAPRHVALAAAGGPFLAAAEHADRLIEVGVPDGRVLARLPTARFPHDALQIGGLTFVADQLAGGIDVIAGALGLRHVSGPQVPTSLAATAGRLAVVDAATHELVVDDLVTGVQVSRLPAGVGPTHAVADRDGRVYVLDTATGRLLGFSLLDRPAQEVSVDLGGHPYGVAIDRRRERLWITDPSTDRLVGLALSGVSPRPFVSLPTVRQPNSVAVDEASGRVFVAGRASGQLELVDPPAGPGG